MTARSRPGDSTKLYTPSLLALAVELADYPLDEHAPLTGRARSRTCGSEVILSAHPDTEGRMGQIGLQVAACAVGQASAALFARNAPGLSADEIAARADALERWCSGGEGPPPAIEGLALLEPARDFPARHNAILLPWRAALDALD